MTPRVARPGVTFEITDTWQCGCSRTYDFRNHYVAAHWRDVLKHKCPCGYEHIFRAGRVQTAQWKRGTYENG